MTRSLFAIAALLLASAVLAAPAPDPFRSGWGNPQDPSRDCKICLNGGALIIEMPGTDHDYNTLRKRLNAPRLLREFEGDFEMRIRLRIDSAPSAKSTVKGQSSFLSAGFLIIPPEPFFLRFIRLEYGIAGEGDAADGFTANLHGGNEGGLSNLTRDKRRSDWPFKTKLDQVYLSLVREENLLHYSISSDGKSWVTMGGGGVGGLPSKLKVGLAAYTTSSEPSQVRFDQLKITNRNRTPWGFVSKWGDPVDPDKDCKIKRDTDFLDIEMPGTSHGYDPVRKQFNAPRLICDLEGNFDLQVRVRIDSRPSARSTVKGQPAFVSAGFLLIYPETDYPICDRLEYAVSQQGSRPDAYVDAPRLARPRRKESVPKGRRADSYAIMKTWIGTPQRTGNTLEWDHGRPRPFNNLLWERGWQDWPLPDKAEYVYLRLDHQVGWAGFFISPDGEKWTRLESLPHVTAKCKVGLAAYSTSSEPSKVVFDRLMLRRIVRKKR